MNKQRTLFFWLAVVAVVLAFGVVTLGAYVRLSDAGLGCPDWPGCYGHLTVPDEAHELQAAQDNFIRPVEAPKAWKEMVHRYFASTLGVLILLLAAVAWRNRGQPDQPFKLPLFLVVLVIFQGLLGMWTVTWLLKPLVVTLHLLGGMATLALLWLCVLRGSGWQPALAAVTPVWRNWALLALVVLAVQIFLGGWTSSNYAALACPDFPTCQGVWWPLQTDFGAGFTLWHGLGIDYEGGILDHPARVAIHFTHRLGALLTALVVGGLALLLLLWGGMRRLRLLGGALAAALLLQVSIGISVVKFALPLPIAVMHNSGAAILLLTLVAVCYALWRRPPTA